jgi:hypothetical protein
MVTVRAPPSAGAQSMAASPAEGEVGEGTGVCKRHWCLVVHGSSNTIAGRPAHANVRSAIQDT